MRHWRWLAPSPSIWYLLMRRSFRQRRAPLQVQRCTLSYLKMLPCKCLSPDVTPRSNFLLRGVTHFCTRSQTLHTPYKSPRIAWELFFVICRPFWECQVLLVARHRSCATTRSAHGIAASEPIGHHMSRFSLFVSALALKHYTHYTPHLVL